MAKITIDLNKSIEENASIYFEKSKKQKRKLEGAKAALEQSRKKLAKLERQQQFEEKDIKEKIERKKKWYEKFRWFIASNGMLVIGGRDATTNEIVIKKHTGENDIVFHTDMAGSPFFVLKTGGNKPDEDIFKEVADAVCTFSRAWKLGLSTQSVFWVKPEQVTKQAQSGEYLQKGAFMIKGKTNYIDNKINVAVGITEDGAIMSGPVEAVKKHCKKFVQVEPGNMKTSDVAKKIKKHLEAADLDEIIRALPAGGCKIK